MADWDEFIDAWYGDDVPALWRMLDEVRSEPHEDPDDDQAFEACVLCALAMESQVPYAVAAAACDVARRRGTAAWPTYLQMQAAFQFRDHAEAGRVTSMFPDEVFEAGDPDRLIRVWDVRGATALHTHDVQSFCRWLSAIGEALQDQDRFEFLTGHPPLAAVSLGKQYEAEEGNPPDKRVSVRQCITAFEQRVDLAFYYGDVYPRDTPTAE